MTEATLLAPVLGFLGHLLPADMAGLDFMKRALLAVLFVGPTAAVIGVPLVHFRMAFFSDAIGHSAFTGVALGVLLGIHPLVTMVAFGLFVAWAIATVKGRTDLSTDTVIGVFFSTVVALGIAIISVRKGLTRNLQGFLYGDLLAVSDTELLWMAALAALVAGYLFLTLNRLLLLGAHEGIARAMRIRTRALEISFALVTALVVTTAIRAVGILLVTALLVVPAAAARNIAGSVASAFAIAVGVALFSGIGGLVASFYLDSATGATVVLFSSACFTLTLAVRAFVPR
jgi:zinc transport system permease protein